MSSLQTIAHFDADGSVHFKAPGLALPGEHPILVVVEDQLGITGTGEFPALHPIAVEAWPKGASFRRADIYGEDGR